MPTTQWRAAPGLMAALRDEPQRFEFFQAVRLLDLNGQMARLRFRNRLSLAFPPSQIDSITDDGGDGGDCIGITPAFMGLLGSHGVLPLHYSERIGRHELDSGDGGPRAFLDLLSHSALAMFYLAWAKHRPDCMGRPDGGDEFRDILTALAGVRAADGRVDAETLARYAMQIRGRAVSAPLMAGVYADYFGVPFVFEQLVGEWQTLPPAHQAQLGRANVDLGAGVLLGERLFRCDSRARLRIGPLDRQQYADFLRGGSAANALQALLELHCGAGMTYEIHLIQRARDVRGARLDGGCRLGVDAFLVAEPPACDRDELMYLLHT